MPRNQAPRGLQVVDSSLLMQGLAQSLERLDFCRPHSQQAPAAKQAPSGDIHLCAGHCTTRDYKFPASGHLQQSMHLEYCANHCNSSERIAPLQRPEGICSREVGMHMSAMCETPSRTIALMHWLPLSPPGKVSLLTQGQNSSIFRRVTCNAHPEPLMRAGPLSPPVNSGLPTQGHSAVIRHVAGSWGLHHCQH